MNQTFTIISGEPFYTTKEKIRTQEAWPSEKKNLIRANNKALDR